MLYAKPRKVFLTVALHIVGVEFNYSGPSSMYLIPKHSIRNDFDFAKI